MVKRGIGRSARNRAAIACALLVWVTGCAAPPELVGSPQIQASMLLGDGPELRRDLCPVERRFDPEFGSRRSFLRRRSWEEAITLFTELLDTNPDDVRSLEGRGLLCADLGYLRAAERDLERATEIMPGAARIWHDLGCVRVLLGLRIGALDALCRAYALGDDGQELHSHLARVYRSLGEKGMAEKHGRLAEAWASAALERADRGTLVSQRDSGSPE